MSTLLYTAFGETRLANGATNTDYRYTGHTAHSASAGGREEAELGLYFYNARWYDPSLGRFTQPDSLVPNPGNPMDWDRYAYVRNNPMKYNDPTGHDVGCPGYDASHCASNSLVKRLNSPSTPLYRTPIYASGYCIYSNLNPQRIPIQQERVMFQNLSLSSKAMLDVSFLLILIILCLREFVISVLILFKDKKYKLSAVLLFWPIVLLIKAFSRDEYDRILSNYYRRIRFFAFTSLFGSVFLVITFVQALKNSIGA